MSRDLITIAIPIYNETEPAKRVITDAYALPLHKEIIVIDDGSTLPETLAILTFIKSKYPDIRIITNTPNIGKALSIQKAINEAHGNIFVILDSDYELDPHDIVLLYRTLISSGASLVNGDRHIVYKEDSLQFTSQFSRLSRFILKMGTKLLYGSSIQDVLSGYKMFYTNLFKKHHFSSKRFGLETEFIVETIKKGRKIVEIPVKYYPRSYKEGKKINIIDSIEILWVLFQNSLPLKKLRWIFVPTIVFITSFILYTHTMRYYPTTDALPNTLLGINLLENHRVDLTNLVPYLHDRELLGIVVRSEDGMYFSKTGPLTGLLSIPIIVITNLFFGMKDLLSKAGTGEIPLYYIYTLGKYVGAFYSAASAALLILVLRALDTRRITTYIATCTYITATGVFNTAAQANWQHGPSLFFIMLFLYLTHSYKHSYTHIAWIGFMGAILMSIRLSNAFYLIMPMIYLNTVFLTKKEKLKACSYYAGGFIFSYCIIQGISALYGIPGGYTDEILFSLINWNVSLFIQNIFALFFSYNQGLLMAFPIFTLGLTALPYVYRLHKPFERALIPTLILFILFAGSWWMWSGGYSPPARMLIETTPILILLLALAWDMWSTKPIFKTLFIITFLLSVTTNAVSVYMATSAWHDAYGKHGHVNQLDNAWYNKPTHIQYHLSQQMIYITHVISTANGPVQINRVYRPSLHHKGIVQLFDGRRDLISSQL